MAKNIFIGVLSLLLIGTVCGLAIVGSGLFKARSDLEILNRSVNSRVKYYDELEAIAKQREQDIIRLESIERERQNYYRELAEIINRAKHE